MTIEAMAFDKDGTLLDFQATWGGWAVDLVQRMAAGDAAVQGAIADALALDMANRSVRPGSVVIAGTARDIALKLAGIDGLPDVGNLADYLIEQSLEVTAVPLVPLVPFFNDLRSRGLALGVVTNDAHAAMQGQLAALDIAHLFDFVAGYDSGFGAKPDPDPCLAFAAHVGKDPARCAMVGDSLHDLVAGKAAGMVAIGVTSGLAPREELAAVADVVLDDITQIPAWLDAR